MIFKECILLCVSTIYELCLSCQIQQYTKKLTHISLCITDFIRHSHVSACEGIIRRHIKKPYTIELCLLYGSTYCMATELGISTFSCIILLYYVVVTIGFWRWCTTFRDIWLSDSIHRPSIKRQN
jgi:hypothetical protein